MKPDVRRAEREDVGYGEQQGLPKLRLHCEASRPSLREVYERFGFRHHSDKHIGRWSMARYELPVQSHAAQQGDDASLSTG